MRFQKDRAQAATEGREEFEFDGKTYPTNIAAPAEKSNPQGK